MEQLMAIFRLILDLINVLIIFQSFIFFTDMAHLGYI